MILHSNGDHVALIHIAERQNISKNYLEQVFSTLRKAGIVKSVKGSQGGYILSQKASLISVGDVLMALEGSLSVISYSGDTQINGIEKCIKKNLWDVMDNALVEILNNMSLDDLVNVYKKENNSMMYYI